MCGRYYVDDETMREIERLVGDIDRKECLRGARDIYPSQEAAVLTGKRPALSVEFMHWGFLQYQKKGLLINARAETAPEKKTFRESVLHRRCVIPAGKFYEWNAAKNKVTFFREDTPVIYMAGFYNRFQEEDRFVILTTAANASMEKVHDRMPLILEEKEVEDWIYNPAFWETALHKIPPLLQQYQPYVQQSLF